MNKTNTPLPRRLVSALDSPKFFRVIVLLLIVQAAWIALSGRYPMAFDEDFHFGIIRLYAHHLSPFWAGQPENADMFGAVARDPSYLYQYLMSFPYRLVSAFTGDQTIQVLAMRGINIGLFAGGLALYRRLLLKTGASKALVHFCLLIFVLVPIVPLLAAQINYDNLLLPLTALAFLMAVNFSSSLTRRKYLDIKSLGALLVLCVLISLVKYAFLPLLMVVFLFVLARLWRRCGSPAAIWRDIAVSWRRLGRWSRVGLVAAILVSSGLFLQRYGVNLVRYHAPVPECSQVLSVEQCSEYGPWNRDYNLKLMNSGGPRNPGKFVEEWFYGMWFRTFFAVDGQATDYQTRGPLILPAVSGAVFAVAALAALALTGRKVFKKYDRRVLWLFVAGIFVYVSTLWLDDYEAYLRTGQPVAINGRYLLPVLPLALLIAVAAINELVRKKETLKVSLAAVMIFCLVWGGGALTYILRSNDDWYWPNPAMRSANHAIQRDLGPAIPGNNNLIEFWRPDI